MTAVFITPLAYPLSGALRYCRLLTIGTSRHVTACRSSIPADEPVLITARRPADVCSACDADLKVRSARNEDLTLYFQEIGTRAALTVEQAAGAEDARGEWER